MIQNQQSRFSKSRKELPISNYQIPPVYASTQEQAFLTHHELFNFYDSYFFANILEKCVVKWSTRMTRCAGTCKYQGFGSSTITLSEPLLKYRSFNQLKETLLHQMIHAYLFITDPESCKYEGGHGDAFKTVMHQINAVTGLRITVYHSFHEEVRLYQKHVWRCDGRCREQAPFFGYVKRSMNRPPQKADHWFLRHQSQCGGTFIKISEPERNSSKSPTTSAQAKGKNKLEKQKNRSITDFLPNKKVKKDKEGKQNDKLQNPFKAFTGTGVTIGSFLDPIKEVQQQQMPTTDDNDFLFS